MGWSLMEHFVLWAALAHPVETYAQITVRVYNYATVSPDILTSVKNEASLIFQQAGIDTSWLDCRRALPTSSVPRQCQEPLGPTDLVLRIVLEPKSDGDRMAFSGLGFAFATKEGSTLATLFYDRVQQLAKQGISSVAQILGHAAAHEIGHLLLATMKHFPTGIMRANWEQEDFWRMAKGALLFTREQSQLMRAEISRRAR
jgi:hypothetical protein